MDSTFGPRLLGHFDFTLLFEHAIFQIGPSSILIFTLPFYLHRIITCQPLVRPGWLLWAKAAVAAGMAAVQLASVVFWFKSPLDSRVAEAAAILYFLGSIGVIMITYASHIYFLQPVIFLASYLNVTLLLDLATIYTYYHRTGLDSIARITCSLPALKLLLLVLEEVSKRPLIISENRYQLSDEVTAGFWNRATFLWINPLLLFGFRNIIHNGDLPDIGEQFDSRRLHENLRRSWGKQDQMSTNALLRAIVFSTPWLLVFVLLPRLFLVGFTLGQPFLLQDVVSFSGGTTAQPDYISREQEATSLILATALIFCGKALSRTWFSHIRNQIMVCIRGGLASLIYDKSLRLGGAEAEDSAAITLVTADIPGIEALISLWYDLFAMVLEVAFGITVLTWFVDAASAVAVICTILATILSQHISKQLNTTRKIWNGRIQDRVAATSNVLAQTKDIKMTGLAKSMGKYLKELRAEEIKASLRARRLNCLSFALGSFADAMTPAAVVAAALYWTKTLDPTAPARFYTVLAVVTLLTDPLSNLIVSLPGWASGFACLSRIQNYLTQEEPQDPRRFQSPSRPNSSRASNSRPARPPPLLIQLEGINVTMDLTGTILRNASISIKPGEVTMIHGSVGCGKSTLLNVMLGEMLLRNGTVTLYTRSISFAGQKPWLLNTTIRLNIIGRKSYNHVLYQRVIFICDLATDFQQLPDGDQTVIGSGGCQLSGGQKQRISIARALYVEATVTILDDPFSSLDIDTSSLIRIRLISDGNAAPNGRALVMTTTMKQHLVDADTVYRVQTDGHVVQLTQDQVDSELDELARNHRARAATIPSANANSVVSFEPPSVQPATDNDLDNKRELIAESYGSFSVYKYFLRPAGAMTIIIWLMFEGIAAASERLPNVYIRIWLENNASNNLYYIGYALLCLAHPIFNGSTAAYFFWLVNAPTMTKLHDNLVDATLGASFAFLADEDTGSILNRFSSDMNLATQRIPALIVPTIWRTYAILMDIAIISAGAAYTAAIIPFFGIFIIGIQRFYLRTSRQLRALELDTSKSLIRHLVETAAGIVHVRAFCWQEEVMNDFFEMLDIAQRPFYLLYCVQQWLECVLDLSSSGAAVLVVTFAVKFSNTASANSMGLAFLSLIGFSGTVTMWVKSSVAMEIAFGAVARIRAFVEATPKETYKNDRGPVSEDWPATGVLELNCVSAVYGQEPAHASQINNLTVTIRPGLNGSLGIIGRTGSGKTTVLLSILNLLNYKGTISIDSREIRTICPDLLRSRITTITQDGIHLLGSVKFNIDPFHNSFRPSTCIVNDTMCESVLQRVGLWDTINARGGLTARMKDMRLSEGQRQLFQFARAMLHHETMRTKIILMDEATSSLDEDTEARVINTIDSVFAGCTRIVISHREAALSSSHSIIRLNGSQTQLVR